MSTFTIPYKQEKGLPRVFIGSSVESLKIAESIQVALDHGYEPTVWTQGVFYLSSSTLDDLITQFKSSDFAIFVFTPDDVVRIREVAQPAIRDNVVFEFGLAIGIIGKSRVFAIQPRNSKHHIASDLVGLSIADYNSDRSDSNLIAAVGSAMTHIKSQIEKNQKETIPRKVEVAIGPIEPIYEKFEILHPYEDAHVNAMLYGMDGRAILWTPMYEKGKVIGDNIGVFLSNKLKIIISKV